MSAALIPHDAALGVRTFGHWTAIGSADLTGKRLICRCQCSKVATVSLEALTSGSSTSCSCAALTPFQRQAARVAAHRRRQRLDDFREWRPGR